jgi:hypothetical protein
MRKLSIIFLSAFIILGFFTENGKSSETIKVYKGSVPDGPIVNEGIEFDVHAPALAMESSVDVRGSSDGNKWFDMGYYYLDTNLKIVHLKIYRVRAGWKYMVIVRNPS